MARSTLGSLITRVRELISSGTADYTVGTASYWTDDQIQAVLDRNRLDFADSQLMPLREVNSGGTVVYYVHQCGFTNLEDTNGGTAVLYVRNSSGTRAGTTDYTLDGFAGRVTFVADTAGTVYYLTGRSYDIYAAAAEIWRSKAGHVAERFDFTADGATFRASQLVEQYTKMADKYSAMATFGSGASSISTSTFVRADVAISSDYQYSNGGTFHVRYD